MANRQLTVAVLVAMLVGFLMGAGALRYAELTADIMVASTDFVKRSQRTNETYLDQGDQNPGVPDARNRARTDETRTEKGVTAAQIARSCANSNDRAGCYEDAIRCAVDNICE